MFQSLTAVPPAFLLLCGWMGGVLTLLALITVSAGIARRSALKAELAAWQTRSQQLEMAGKAAWDELQGLKASLAAKPEAPKPTLKAVPNEDPPAPKADA